MNHCPREAAAAVVRGKIFCAGGTSWTRLNSVECYDPSSDVWTIICNVPQEIRGYMAAEMNGLFIIMGGDEGEEDYSKKVWALDTKNKNAAWIEKTSMSIPHNNFSIAKIHDELFICGGINRCFGRATRSVEIFDGEFWRNGPKMTANRVQAAAVVIPINFFEVFEANEDSLNTLYARGSTLESLKIIFSFQECRNIF